MPRQKPSTGRRTTSSHNDPLRPEERSRLERAIARVATELRAVLRQLGQEAGRPQALERTTKLGRATVHRILALTKIERGGELGAVLGAPGADALEAFASSLNGKIPSKTAGELRLAVAQYRRALEDVGGSKVVVQARVRATRGTPDDEPAARTRRDLVLREQMFRQVSELLGRETDTRMDLTFFRPSGRVDICDYAQVRGIFGYRGRRDGLPMSIELLGRVRRPDGSAMTLLDLDGRPASDHLSSTVLTDFSTTPPPIVLSQGLGPRVRNVVDPAFVGEGGSVDFVVGYQRREALHHPRLEETRTLEVGALHRDPARHLIVEVWIDRSLAVGAIPDLATFVWSPTLETSLADHWTDRLPNSIPLQVLGLGLSRARTAAHARHEELLRHVFGRLGWDPETFIGFRAEIDYPLFGGAYFITFDYGTWNG